MEDYKEIIKAMLLRDFSPYPPKGEHVFESKAPSPKERGGERMTTIDVLQMVRGVIPQSPIDEHDIFEVLKETGFQYGIDEESGLYLWFLFKKM